MRGKMFRSILVSLVLLLGLTCMASAEEYVTNGAGTLGYENGTYTATYTECQAEQQYVLLVVKKTDSRVISADTIMYIDQAKSDADGDVTFTFIPKSTPDCEVLLGGVFPNGEGETPVTSPVVLGELIGKGVTVTGKVTYQPSPVGATVTLYSGETQVATATTDASGNYTLESVPVASGYKLVVTKPGYCSYTISNLAIEEEGSLGVIDISYIAGDVDRNGEINGFDLAALLSDFNHTAAQGNIIDEKTDIDGNGEINGFDLGALLSGFNKTSVNVDAAE